MQLIQNRTKIKTMKSKGTTKLGRPPLPHSDKGVMPTCRIRRELWQKLQEKAKKDGTSTRSILEKLINSVV